MDPFLNPKYIGWTHYEIQLYRMDPLWNPFLGNGLTMKPKREHPLRSILWNTLLPLLSRYLAFTNDEMKKVLRQKIVTFALTSIDIEEGLILTDNNSCILLKTTENFSNQLAFI